MSKNKNNRTGVVYSTFSDFNYEFEGDNQEETLEPAKQKLRVFFEKKGRGGKDATIIKGFVGTEEDIKNLAKLLKNKCATGGSTKEGEIVIQGNLKEKVIKSLIDFGYKDSK